jgi:hypothetical protein
MEEMLNIIFALAKAAAEDITAVRGINYVRTRVWRHYTIAVYDVFLNTGEFFQANVLFAYHPSLAEEYERLSGVCTRLTLHTAIYAKMEQLHETPVEVSIG